MLRNNDNDNGQWPPKNAATVHLPLPRLMDDSFYSTYSWPWIDGFCPFICQKKNQNEGSGFAETLKKTSATPNIAPKAKDRVLTIKW
jgi:hypothetical protein